MLTLGPCTLQDLTKDVVRIDVIPQQSLDTIRVGETLPWDLTHLGFLLTIAFCHVVWVSRPLAVWAHSAGIVFDYLSEFVASACVAGLAHIDEHQVLREQDEPELEAHPEEHHRRAPLCPLFCLTAAIEETHALHNMCFANRTIVSMKDFRSWLCKSGKCKS